MRYHYVFMALAMFLLALATMTCAEDSMHIFTAPNGRALKASILEYNDRNGKIRIEREDGRKVWVHPKIFSQNSQHYIQQWVLADKFMSAAAFRIQTESSKDTATSYYPGIDRCKKSEKTNVEYEITLNNRSDYLFQDLKVEFRFFVFVQGYGDNDDRSRVIGGSLRVGELPAGAVLSEQVPSLELLTTYKLTQEWSRALQATTSYSTKTSEEQLEGIWIRVYGPELDGIPSVREWCYPSDTIKNYFWTDDHEQIAAVSSKVAASSSQRAGGSSPPARKEDPMRAEVLSLMQQAKAYLGSRPAKALELYQEAYRKSNSSDIELKIGLCYIWNLKPNNITLGTEWLKKAAERDNYRACFRLARFYSAYIDPQYHDAEKGIEYGLKAVSIAPKDCNGYDALAQAYSRDGQFEKAVEQQLMVIKLYKEAGGNAQVIASMEEALQRYRDHIPCPPH